MRDSGTSISVANVGQWSNKFKRTQPPVKRPNVVPNGGSHLSSEGTIRNCGIGMAYTVAHELGHLLGLGHTDPPSIMKSGGAAGTTTVFSAAQLSAIRKRVAFTLLPKSINPYYGAAMAAQSAATVARPLNAATQRSNHQCRRQAPAVVVQPECTCANGAAATGAACATDKAELCMSCSKEYFQSGDNRCGACRSRCGSGTTETTACTTSSNRVCAGTQAATDEGGTTSTTSNTSNQGDDSVSFVTVVVVAMFSKLGHRFRRR